MLSDEQKDRPLRRRCGLTCRHNELGPLHHRLSEPVYLPAAVMLTWGVAEKAVFSARLTLAFMELEGKELGLRNQNNDY